MDRKMIWTLRIFWLLVGFMIGQLTQPSNAQVHYGPGFTRPNLGLSEMEIMQIQMETSARNAERDRKAEEQARLERELDADKKEFEFIYETAVLWSRLAEAEDGYFQVKWNQKQTDVTKHLEIKMLKQELLKRGKDVEKHLRRK